MKLAIPVHRGRNIATMQACNKSIFVIRDYCRSDTLEYDGGIAQDDTVLDI